MTEHEYNMTFSEWCNATKGTDMKLNEYGDAHFLDPKRQDATTKYHELWEMERKEYRMREKNNAITNALESIKNAGIECVLSSYQSGHIKAKGKHGIIRSYYVTTGTIAGYRGTTIEGLDAFIRLCKEG